MKHPASTVVAGLLVIPGLILAACATPAASSAPSSASPTPPPASASPTVEPSAVFDPSLESEAWFASNWDSKGIRLTHRDGSSSIEILTDLPTGAKPWNPDWSPSGDQLVVNVNIGPSGAILISDLDGGRQQVIACDAPCLGYGAPAWSRDGKRIAYAQAAESGLKITVFDVESGSTTDVLEMNEPGSDIDTVRWSPTGEELVAILHRWNAEDDTKLDSAAVVVVPIADGSVREITDANDFASYPDWHPTQDLIVFGTHWEGSGDRASNLYTIRSDGSGLTQITDFPPGGTRGGQATWSPDGTLIVFTLGTDPNSSELPHIGTIAPDGSNLIDLGAPGTHNRLRPRP